MPSHRKQHMTPYRPPALAAPQRLHDWDLIVCNSSGGKDSQTLLRQLIHLADHQGYSRQRIVVAHADLGHVEWRGAKALAHQHAKLYGVDFRIAARRQGTLLDLVRARGKWYSPKIRFCTSEMKRTPIDTLIRRLHRERAIPGKRFRVLNCIGERAEESSRRAKKPPFACNTRITTKRTRDVYDWRPLHRWRESEVWRDITHSGVPYHHAYDLGFGRLACVLCVFAPRDALILAGIHNPELLKEYVSIEAEINHTFQYKRSLASIAEAIASGETPPAKIPSWIM